MEDITEYEDPSSNYRVTAFLCQSSSQAYCLRVTVTIPAWLPDQKGRFFVLFTDFFVVVRKIMPAPLTDIVRGRILALKEQGNSGYVVRKILSGIPIDVSVRAINQLWKKKLIGGSQNAGKIPGAKWRKLKTVRTPKVIRKVKQMVQSGNPRT